MQDGAEVNETTTAEGEDLGDMACSRLHMGIAERGKSHAVEGNHTKALQYYRVAMRIAVAAKEPEIFFRHYLECVMESLELMGAYDEVLAYCDKAIALYTETPPPNVMATMDLASIHLRRGAILLKQNEREEAKSSLQAAREIARSIGGTVALAGVPLRWAQVGYAIEPARVLAEQKRSGYFLIRKDMIDASRAIELSDADLGQAF